MEEPLRIFIASPGDVSEEREEVNSIVQSVSDSNRSAGLPRVECCGYEEVSGGVGRPQSVINKELMKCDYGIVLFKKKWGSDPGPLEPGMKPYYTSGTEEELFTCLLALQNPAAKMKDVLVVFLPAQRIDPNIKALQLQIKENHCLLYEQPRSREKFKSSIRRRILSWMDSLDKREVSNVSLVPSSTIDVLRVDYSLRKGLTLESQGERSRAKEFFQFAAEHGGAVEKLAFGKFLSHQGFLDKAIFWNESALDDIDERNVNSSRLKAKVYMAVGHVQRRQNQLTKAIMSQERALRCLKSEQSSVGLREKAEIYDALALAFHDNEQYLEALDSFQKALIIREHEKDKQGILHSYINLARENMNIGNNAEAKSMLDIAKGKKNDETDFSLQANYYALKVQLDRQMSVASANILSDAIKCLNYNEGLGNQNGTAVALKNLAQLYADMGDFTKARAKAEICLKNNEAAGNVSGVLASHHLLAEIAVSEQNWALAVAEYDKELNYYEDQPRANIRKAWTLLYKAGALTYLGKAELANKDATLASNLMGKGNSKFNAAWMKLQAEISELMKTK